MISGAPSAMSITPIGPAAAGTVAFRTRGRVHVAAIVKACFAFVPDRPMAPAEPEPIVLADAHRDKVPVRGLVAASEIAPYRPRADVLLYGHACAYGGQPLRAFAVRLMVAQGGRTILDKRLAVQGARDRHTGEVTPFVKMPLSWELAAIGPDPEENPSGVPERPGLEANIFDPQRRGRPAGFEPIPERWPLRRKQLGALDPRILRAAIPDIPEAFPWAYFQAAPPDQRIDFLRGDEWIALEGMHPEVTRLTSCLPGARGVARVYGPAPDLAAGRPVPLVADTITIDADRRGCSVIWRGSFPLASEDDLRRLHIFAGVEIGGQHLPFPAAYTAPAASIPPAAPETAEVPAQLQARIRSASALPFEPAPPAGAVRPEADPGGGRRPPPQHKDSGTMAIPVMRPDELRAPTPFEGPPGTRAPTGPPGTRAPTGPPGTRTPTGQPRIVALDQTIVPDEAAPIAPATPFAPIAPASPFAPVASPPASAISFDLLRSPPAPGRPGVFDMTAAPPAAPAPRPATPFERPLVPPEPARATPPPYDPAEIEVPQAAYMPHDARPREEADPRASAAPPIPKPTLAPPALVDVAGEGDAPATLGAHFLAAMARAGQPAAHP
jgi:hypothetical protein